MAQQGETSARPLPKNPSICSGRLGLLLQPSQSYFVALILWGCLLKSQVEGSFWDSKA
jgi:hypothetical protein